MNEESFDRLTRILASGMSRRRALKLLASGLAGGILTRLGSAAGSTPPPANAPQSEDEIADLIGFGGHMADTISKAKSYYDYFTNLAACMDRGYNEQTCNGVAGWCLINTTLLSASILGWVAAFGVFDAFKQDCGNGQCFQCCRVPGTNFKCHTSFIGFPVINCNPLYEPGASAAGITLIIDPNAQPGDACLFIPQTCQHIPICHVPGLGYQNLLNDPRAIKQRARTYAEWAQRLWKEFLNNFGTSRQAGTTATLADAAVSTLSLLRLMHLITGRGRKGWHQQIESGLVTDWSKPAFKIVDSQGQYVEPASHFNGVMQLGLLRLLACIPNLAQRLAYVESRIWTDDEKQQYLAMIGDADTELLTYMSPEALAILKQISSLQDYKLLAVPLPGENIPNNLFNGVLLGRPPYMRATFQRTGNTGIALALVVDDPEQSSGVPLASPVMVHWGDGQVTQHTLPAGVRTLTMSHQYATGGSYRVYATVENNTGLRGFCVLTVVTTAQSTQPTAPTIPTLAQLTLNELRVDGLQALHQIAFVVSIVNGVDRIPIGISAPVRNGGSTPITTTIGDLVGDNPMYLSTARLVIEPRVIDTIPAGAVFTTSCTFPSLTFGVHATATRSLALHTINVNRTMVRVFAEQSQTPIPADDLPLDGQGNVMIPCLQRVTLGGQVVRIDRIEIPLTAAMFAGFAVGRLPAGTPADTARSYLETKPGIIVPAEQQIYVPLIQR